MAHLTHKLPPFCPPNARVLVLGTMPSAASRAAGFYYMHPRNLFWRLLAELSGELFPHSLVQKQELLTKKRIALWDVLYSCEMQASADASITKPIANNIGMLLEKAPIEAIFTTGAAASRLYTKLCYPLTGIPCRPLPSTSPASPLSHRPEELLERWKPLKDYLI